MSGFFGVQVTVTGTTSGGLFVGAYLAAAPAAGNNNDFAPGGVPVFPGTLAAPYGRLDLTAPGAANLTGLLAGLDGQLLVIRNSGANDLILNNQNAGSAAANRFAIGPGDLDLTPGTSTVAVYYAGTINRWVITL